MRPIEAWFKGRERKKEKGREIRERQKRKRSTQATRPTPPQPSAYAATPPTHTTRSTLPHHLTHVVWSEIHQCMGIDPHREGRERGRDWMREKESKKMVLVTEGGELYEREREMSWKRKVRENKRWREGIKYNYFGLQLCYSAILNVVKENISKIILLNLRKIVLKENG